MINSLLVNACILISFIYLSSQFFENEELNEKTNIISKCLLGVFFGLSGCIMILNGLIIGRETIVDLRVMSILVSAIYCGPVSAIISFACIIVFRIIYFGLDSILIIPTASLILLTGIFSYVSTLKFNFRIKYKLMGTCNIISLIITFLLLGHIHNISEMIKTIAICVVASMLVMILVYYIFLHIHKTNRMYAKLKYESENDFLTGLYNVREFDRRLNALSLNAVNKQEPLSLLMADIDFFKKVNDNYGHVSGDMVLVQLGKVLQDSIRSIDIVARKGGEEFAIILVYCSYENALKIAEKIRKNVEKTVFIVEGNKKINITISIGVGSFPEKTDDPSTLVHDADDALYCAKKTGRNKVM